MKPPPLTLEQLRKLLDEIPDADSDELGYMLQSARRLSSRKNDATTKTEIRDIIAKIEERYTPLRLEEIQHEPCYGEF